MAVARGAAVRGVEASSAAVEKARALGIDAHVGDIGDPARMRELITGSKAVVHTAAIVREYGALEEFRKVNVRGSVCVAEAARDVGARSFVQVSSVMVYGFEYPPNVAEEGPLRGEGNPYCQTKIEGEAAVLRLNDPTTMGVVVVRPGDVYGPGSIPWIVRPLEMMKRGRLLLPLAGQGVINHVFVDNLVDGILLLLEARVFGEAFNVTDGVATTYQRFFSLLAERGGVPAPRSLPAPLMRAGAWAISRLRDLGLSSDEASVDTIAYLSRRNAYSIDKIRGRLGYTPRVSLEEGLALTQGFIDGIRA